RRIESTLELYDCINCDLCISACPNDAIFAYDVTPMDEQTELLHIGGDGPMSREPGQGFAVGESHQLAVVEGACNECSNCEVYCPEHGAPFLVKERVFLSMDDFRREVSSDGFYRDTDILYGRIGGTEIKMSPEPERNRGTIDIDGVRLDVAWDSLEVRSHEARNSEPVQLDTRMLWRMRTVWESIFNSGRPNSVNPEPEAQTTG
ncbi:MAG: 4Fe-4S binding protein, partial [Rhodothermales bacterium]|nr:4Fe-4S binding protein [Rhodothermales bacterium]